jgi:transcriptional regulator with XRE-family HTH domain
MDTDTLNEVVTRRIRDELANRGLSQHDLAGALRWHQAYLSRRLTGAVSWSADDIDEIARCLRLASWQLTTKLIA